MIPAAHLVSTLRPAPAQRPPVKTVFVDNFLCLHNNGVVNVDVVPHLGLTTLATVLERAGHAVEIYDPKIHFISGGWARPEASFLDAWAADLLARAPDIVGFTAYGRSLPYVLRVAERLKRERPALPIVLGGPHPTIVGEEIMAAFGCIDVVVRYEAEPTIVAIVEAVARGGALDAIPGLVYRQGGAVYATPPLRALPEMDELPPPALHLYPIDMLKLSELSIEAGRGCPFSCTFCSTATFFQRRYRMKSNAHMIAEMEAARARFGINNFNLNHDLFGLVKKNLKEFCALVNGRGFTWSCSMRPDTLDEALVGDLGRAGCTHIFFGVESGSPRLQRTMEKRLDVTVCVPIVRAVTGAGMTCTTSFIVGFPDETVADHDLTLDLLGHLLAIDPARVRPQLHVLSPEPGSALAHDERRFAFDGIGPEADEVLDEELIRANPTLFSVFYHYESTLPRWRQVLSSAFVSQVLPELGYFLVTHLCATFFDGSLARLFAAVVPGEPGGELSFERIMTLLRDGLDGVIAELTPRAPYLPALVRLGRVLRAAEPFTPKAAGDDDIGPSAWLVRFDADVEALVQAILTRPEAPRLPPPAPPVERWYLVHRRGAARELALGRITTEVARALRDEAAPPPAAISDIALELDMTLIRGLES